MAADEKDRYIRSLIDKINMFELDKRATELAVEEFQTHFDTVTSTLDSMKKDMESLKAELREERSKRKKAEAKARKLEQQLKDDKVIDINNQSSIKFVCPKLNDIIVQSPTGSKDFIKKTKDNNEYIIKLISTSSRYI